MQGDVECTFFKNKFLKGYWVLGI